MHRYIYKTDITEEVTQKYTFPFTSRVFADCIDGMPMDDDTNYTVLYQELIEKWGKDFTPLDVSKLWLAYQPKDAYCTAERVAFCNFVKGYLPPDSAAYQNPYREWIGAQIRADYFGYMLEHGIYVAPSQFEAMFVSGAHSDEDIEKTIRVLTA